MGSRRMRVAGSPPTPSAFAESLLFSYTGAFSQGDSAERAAALSVDRPRWPPYWANEVRVWSWTVWS